MKYIKCLLVLLMAACFGILLFAGCGSEPETGSSCKKACRSECSKKQPREACNRKGLKRNHMFILDHITKELELSETQIQKLEIIKNEGMSGFAKNHAQKSEIHAALKKQIVAGTPDKDVINKSFDDYYQNQNQVVQSFVGQLVDFYRDLTPEQKRRLVDAVEKFEGSGCRR